MSINKSFAHGLEILFLFDTSTRTLTASQISKRLGYNKSKTYRLLRTLIKYGLLKNQETTQYSLGMNAVRIGLMALKSLNINQIAQPIMRELSHITHETILLTAINGTVGTCLERIDSSQVIRYASFQPGENFSLHCGATGKVMMAYLPEGVWDRIIDKGLIRYTRNTITDPEVLKAHLREIRGTGYAISDREMSPDCKGAAAPIFEASGQLAGGLGIAAPAYRISRKKLMSWAKLVVEKAQEISVGLGLMPQN